MAHPDGPFRLEIRLESETTDFGLLKSTSSTRVHWYGQAPSPIGFALSGSTFYPVKDGYRDSVRVELERGPGNNKLGATIIDEAGDVVLRKPPGRILRSFTFTGRRGGDALPAGVYLVELSTTEPAGNTTSTSRQVRLHPEELRWRKVETTFKAAKVETERYVGPRGELVGSPRGEPRGTLGL